jgi:hypothetical protein
MKKKLYQYLVYVLTGLLLISPLKSQNKEFAIIDEDRSFWSEVLKDGNINNKNLFYAGYVAYKDRLNDLSIQSFQECINKNAPSDLVKGISVYYIGKNLFLLGKYADSIAQFSTLQMFNLEKFNYIKYAGLINMAIAYQKINDTKKFRENLQKVINTDTEGIYGKIAQDMLR